MKKSSLKIIFPFFFILILLAQARIATPNGNELEIAFLRQAYLKSLWKMECGKIAVRQTETADVKHFAQLMTIHYSALCDELSAHLRKRGIIPPNDFDSTQKDTLAYLSRQRGAGIDREYLSMAGDDLLEDLRHYQRGFQQLKDPDLKILVEKSLKTIKEDSILADRTLRSIPPPVLK